MENSHLKNIGGLLFATLCISTSGVLGKYIDFPTESTVWFRAALAALFLYGYSKFKKIDLSLKNKKDFFPFLLSAIFMAAHWLTYFYALKLSNVAIGMLSLFTYPVIISLLEPLILKTKLNPIHIFLGLMVMLGIYILAPELSLESSTTKGILFGLLSALCFSLRILILKQHVANYNASTLMFYQTIIVTFLLAPFLFIDDLSNIKSQFPYLLMLAVITTAVGHTLLVNTLRFFTATTASIISSVQPIFGIIIAYFFISEIPTIKTFIGGSLIILTVVIEGIRSKKKKALK